MKIHLFNLLLITLLSSCTVYNLRERWESDTCPDHNVKLKKALVRTSAGGFAGGFSDYYRDHYQASNGLPKPTQNAKYIYLRPGNSYPAFEYAKIYYCKKCHREVKVLRKEDKAQKRKAWSEQKVKLNQPDVIVTCLNFLEQQQFSDNTRINRIYALNEAKDGYRSYGHFIDVKDTKSEVIELLNLLSETKELLVLKNRFTNREPLKSEILKDKLVSRRSLRNKDAKVYLEITKIAYPSRSSEGVYAAVHATLQPLNIPIFTNIIVDGDELKVKFYRFKQ